MMLAFLSLMASHSDSPVSSRMAPPHESDCVVPLQDVKRHIWTRSCLDKERDLRSSAQHSRERIGVAGPLLRLRCARQRASRREDDSLRNEIAPIVEPYKRPYVGIEYGVIMRRGHF